MRPLKQLCDPIHAICRLDLSIPASCVDYGSNLLFMKAVKTLKALVSAGHAVLIVSHRGHPNLSCPAGCDSLLPLLPALEQVCGKKIHWLPDWPQQAWRPSLGQVYLAENTRLLAGELNCHPELVAKMIKGVDAIVYDALSVAHMAHASTSGLTQSSLPVYSGLAFEYEWQAFMPSDLIGSGCGFILGGSSPQAKITLLPALAERFDWVMVAGMLLPNFIRAYQDKCVTDDDYIAKWLLSKQNIHVPLDVRTYDGSYMGLGEVNKPADVCDIGPKTIAWWRDVVRHSLHVMWYGPVGFHEFVHGKDGSLALFQELSQSSGISMLLGYDTVALCQAAGYLNDIDQYSFAGEALLNAMLDKPMVALKRDKYEQTN